MHTNRKLTPNLKHNDRSTKEKHKNVFGEKTHLNQIDKSAKEAMEEINQLYKEAMKKLEGKKGKRTPKESSYTEMIFEVDENHTLEDCQRLADKICELTGFRRIQVSLHKDEGHYEDDGTFKTHNHAHAVFFTLSEKDGKQLARREKGLSDTNLSKLQDLAYEVLRGGVREKSNEKKAYIPLYTQYKAQKELEQRENSLKQKESVLRAKESEIQGKELKEQEYKHYQELLAKQEQKDWGYYAIPLGYDIIKDLETLGNDIYEPLRNVYAMEYINFLAEKTKLSILFDGFADDNQSPIVKVQYSKDQKALNRDEFIKLLRQNLPKQEDILNFRTFQSMINLVSILDNNHQALKSLGITKSNTPSKVTIKDSVKKLVRAMQGKSISD